jgi:hypothetical protein
MVEHCPFSRRLASAWWAPSRRNTKRWIPRIAITFLATLLVTGGATLAGAQIGGPPAEPPVLIRWPSREHATLQAAIDALADGGKVVIAPGVFQVANPVYIRGKRVTIEGAGCDELPKGRAPRKVTQLVGPLPDRVVEFETVTGLFNYEDAGGILRGLKLTGFDAGITARDGAAAGRRGGSLEVEATCISDTGRGIAWSASSALLAKNLAIRRVSWNGISAINIPFGLHSFIDVLIQDAANACAAFKKTIAHVTGVFGGCGMGGGIIAESSALTIGNALVLNSAGPGITAFGLGPAAVSWTYIWDSTISDTTGGGIILINQLSAGISNTKIFDTRSFTPSGALGDGLIVLGVSSQADTPNWVSVDNVFVGNSARAAVSNFGGKVSLHKSTLQCAAFELAGEAFLGHPFVLADHGGNACGCPLANQNCVAVSVGLEPPPAIGSDP